MKSKASKDKEIVGSNLLLESFVKYSPVPIQIHSTDGLLIDFNPAYARLFSLSESIMANLLNKYNVLEDMEVVKLGIMPYVEKAFAGEVVSFPEYEYDPADTLTALGIDYLNVEKRWIKTQGYSIKDEEERITHIVFISENITARKKAEIVSIESEQKFKDLFEQSPIVHEIYDRSGRLVEANTAFEKLWNLKKEDIVGKYNVFESKQIEALDYLPHLEKAFSGEIPDIDDLEFDSSLEGVADGKGEKKWVSSWLFPMKDIDGKVTHVVKMHQDITGKKIAEEELLNSHLFTDNLIQSANIMIVGIDTEGKVNIFNPAAERISGYKFDEIIDKDWFSTLVPMEKYPYVHEEFNRLMEGGTPKLFENTILSKNGEERIISWSNNEIIKDNKAAGLISFGIDITDQKKAEEERNRLFNLSTDLICIAGFDGYLKQLNPAWEATLGYSRDELMAKPFLNFIHPDDHHKNDTEVEKLAAGFKTIDFENRCFHKDGSIRYISWTATPLIKEKTMYCIGRDISERKKNEVALTESEEKFRELMSQAPYAISIVNPDGRIDQVNHAFMKLWGFTEEAWPVIKDNYNFLEDAEAIRLGTMPLIEKAFNGESVELPLIEYISKNTLDTIGIETTSNTRWIQVRLYPIKNSTGDVVKVVNVAEDITLRRQAEIALNESEEKFRLLVEQSPFSIQIFNPDGYIDQVNEAFKELWGVRGKELQEVIDNYNVLKDAEAEKLGISAAIQNAFSGREDIILPMIEYDAESTLNATGVEVKANKRWIQARLYPIKNIMGEVINVVDIEEDMTVSILAQQGLRDSEEKYRNLVEHLNEGVLLIQDDKIKFANQVMGQLTGYPAKELIGRGFIDFINMDDLPRIIEIYRERVGMKEWLPYEMSLKLKNGKPVYFEFSASPTIYLGEPAIMVLAHDISERKKAEKQIQQYQQRLKDMARELTNNEEKQRHSIATDLHDHVGQLLASSRLQIAAINAEMEKSVILSKMKDISQGLMAAVAATRNAIFELSPPQLNEIGLMAAISDWVEEEMETKHGIKSTIMDEDGIFAINNEERYLLFRCVRELLINIIKHARANHVTLNGFEKNDILNICVHDNGIGFDYNPDMLENKDFGFGLFSIRERIQNIGGSLEIKSSSETGTRIKLKLPLKK